MERNLKIIIAKHIGFCFGVKRALSIAEKSLKEDPKPIQFLGPLVHNEKVVEELKRKGGKIIAHLKKIKSGTLILRAHGEVLSPEKIKKNVLIKDTTCPLVKRAQDAAKLLVKQGYQVIIIGDQNHPETKGIKKYAEGRVIIIENVSQAKKLPNFKKIGVISQTTQDLNMVNRILEILKNKTRDFKWINTLCPEVQARQKELKKILKKCDGVLVIGSPSSANTKRLAEIIKNAKKKVLLINSTKKLKKNKLKGISFLGIVSGTSAPDWTVKKIIEKLKAL